MSLLVLALLTLGGVIGLVQAHVGYVAATHAFLLSTAAAAPPLALISRLGRGFWGVPLRRVADLLALASLVSLPLGIVLLRELPDWRGRPGIWLDWPGAPVIWHTVGLGALALVGVALVACTSLPDRPLGGRWRGTPRQWYVVTLAAKALGGLYAMLLVFVHLLTTSDLAMSLVPGWQSANFPAYHAVSAVEGGVATTVLGLAVLRQQLGPERVPGATFHASGKLLLALALLWFYFSWAEFLTYWYGRTPAEQGLISLLMSGPLMLGAGLGCCLVPFGLLLWNRVRASVGGVTLAAAIVLVGMLLDRLRVYVAAWAVAGPVSERLHSVPALAMPTVWDILVLIGGPAAVALLLVLATRLVPAVSRWEEAEAALLERERRYLRTRVAVIAKPS